ncbi:MAG: 3-deoxy-7-phosphoheptulonate synthase [Candidatus Aenigmatarchaeota archaeon]
MVSDPYAIIGRDNFRPLPIRIGRLEISQGGPPVFMAGPCAVESRQQLLKIAEQVKEAGADVLRGGAFKPRTAPGGFEGLGEEGLTYLAEARDKLQIPIVTEILSEEHVKLFEKYPIDIYQIGARNMQNFALLKAVARTRKPVLLKRHFGAGISEWLSAAAHIVAAGNDKVILCERGILPVGKNHKEFERYSLHLSAIPIAKQETRLPIIADPSHGTGRCELVEPMARAAIAAGADGLLVDVHYNPAEALVDGHNAIDVERLKRLIAACKGIWSLNPRSAQWLSS